MKYTAHHTARVKLDAGLNDYKNINTDAKDDEKIKK